jgi:hypothetical protein
MLWVRHTMEVRLLLVSSKKGLGVTQTLHMTIKGENIKDSLIVL